MIRERKKKRWRVCGEGKERREFTAEILFVLSLRSSKIDWRSSDKDYDPLSRNNTDLIVLFQWISFIRQSAVSR